MINGDFQTSLCIGPAYLSWKQCKIA